MVLRIKFITSFVLVFLLIEGCTVNDELNRETGDPVLPKTDDLPIDPTYLAPDGSEVRKLSGLERGSLAHFRLAPGRVARAVKHKTVDEIWYIISGQGEMWRSHNPDEPVVNLKPERSVTIPVGVSFQFRKYR